MVKIVFSRAIQLLYPRNQWLLVFAFIILLGLILRLYGTSSLLFTYDQARDAFLSQEISSGNLKIVGPSTDIPGVFHGPLFYYLLAPLYFVGLGNPEVALYAMVIINLLAAIPLYILSYNMLGSKNLALLSVFLYIVSFESVSYARWISNPSPAAAFTMLYILGIWLITQNRRLGWTLTGVGLSMAIQMQLFMLYLIPISFLTVISSGIWKKTGIRSMITGIAISLFLISTFFISEIKFKFQGAKALLEFFLNANHTSDLVTRIGNYFMSVQKLITENLFPQSHTIALLIGIILLILTLHTAKNPKFTKNIAFLYFILLSHIFVFLLSNSMLTYIGLGIGPVILILTAIGITHLAKFSKLAAFSLFLIIVSANIFKIISSNPLGNILFKVQDGMILKDEIKVVEETYKIANGRVFSINTVSNPYKYPTLWSYLYKLHSDKSRVNLPYFRGTTAYSFVGKDILPQSDQPRDVEFLIIEPEVGDNDYLTKLALKEDVHKNDPEIRTIGKFRLLIWERAL